MMIVKSILSIDSTGRCIMKLNIEKGNLFDLPNNYVLCQCISLDCAMGLGIALEFNKYFPGIREYSKQYTIENGCMVTSIVPYTYENRTAISLITKSIYSHKPTYNTLKRSLLRLKNYCINENIKYLGLPALGCGIDKLDIYLVLEIIRRTFENTDLMIEVRLKE